MAKSRTLQDINQDYFQTAAMLGDLIWKVDKFVGNPLGNGQIEDLKRKLRTIDTEMDEFQAKEKREQEEIAKEASKKSNGAAPEQVSKTEATPAALN
jgi:seryl-tRNA synthetase